MWEIFTKFYQNVRNNFYKRAPGIYSIVDKNKMFIKFGASGAVATSVHFSLLYILTDWVEVWYIFSTSIAFIVAFLVSFYMQKFWTFRDDARDKIKQQLGAYLGVAIINLVLNGVGMYIVVDIFEVMYILAQVIVGIIIAGESFCVYRYLIFEEGNNKEKRV